MSKRDVCIPAPIIPKKCGGLIIDRTPGGRPKYITPKRNFKAWLTEDALAASDVAHEDNPYE